jgi:L-asparaginase
VIEATGAGNVPPAAMAGVRAALAGRVPVVLVTRCAGGLVTPAYGYDGGGRVLRDLGVIFGGELPGQKARIKLMVALGLTSDVARIRETFEEPGPTPS